jgi:arylsulfatase A-like enzyme
VPMIARWPGRVPAARESDQVWAFWDLLPTLAEVGGLPAVHGTDGLSMLPTLLGEDQKEPRIPVLGLRSRARYLHAGRPMGTGRDPERLSSARVVQLGS